MKYLRVNLQRQENKPSGALIYPSGYQREIGDYAVDHLYYDADDGEPKLLLAIRDENYSDGMIRDNVDEVNESEAKAIGKEKEVSVEEVNDEAKIRRLTIKSAVGEPLSTEDKAALDPDDPTPGITKRQGFADRVEKHKEVEAFRDASNG